MNPLLNPAVISEIGKLGPAALGIPGSASTGGVCGGATIRFGGGLSGSVCFGVTGGEGPWGSATVEVSGQVAAGFTADGGTMASNAQSPERMSGQSVCGGYGFSSFGGASVVACVGVNDNLELPQLGPDDVPIVTVFTTGSAGPKGGFGPIFGVSNTWVWRIKGSSGNTHPAMPVYCGDFQGAAGCP